MDNKITSLQPQAVWKYFNAICQVPRPWGISIKLPSI